MGYVQVDGKLFTKPVYVGDPGAKGAKVEDKVVLDMVRFPSHMRDGEGVIVEILGRRGSQALTHSRSSMNSTWPASLTEAHWKTPASKPKNLTNRSAAGEKILLPTR